VTPRSARSAADPHAMIAAPQRMANRVPGVSGHREATICSRARRPYRQIQPTRRLLSSTDVGPVQRGDQPPCKHHGDGELNASRGSVVPMSVRSIMQRRTCHRRSPVRQGSSSWHQGLQWTRGGSSGADIRRGGTTALSIATAATDVDFHQFNSRTLCGHARARFSRPIDTAAVSDSNLWVATWTSSQTQD
jgi:hypothetical protein